MKPINTKILWDTLAPIDGEVERFACEAAVLAPNIVQKAGYDPLAFLLSYREGKAKAQVWARKGKDVMLFDFTTGEGEKNVTYPTLTSAMWSFKVEAKSLYEREDTLWLWQSIPEWSRKSA